MEFLNLREPVSAWTHCAWMVLAVPGTVLLWQRSRGELAKQLSLLIFGLCLIFCYASSTLFHGVRPPEQVRVFHTIDHVSIYLLIAGSYTPPAVVLLRGNWRWGVLSLIWLLAAVGILLRLWARDLPLYLSTVLYLMMGWGAILCYFELARTISHRAMRPVVTGGVLYSIGALINLAHWPVLVPGVFGPHEILHLFVMAGSLTHFSFMLEFVVPYERCGRGMLPATALAEAEYRVAG